MIYHTVGRITLRVGIRKNEIYVGIAHHITENGTHFLVTRIIHDMDHYRQVDQRTVVVSLGSGGKPCDGHMPSGSECSDLTYGISPGCRG